MDLVEHWCDYCGTGFNGRAYHGIDGLPDNCETACAHCVVEVLLAQRHHHRGAVETLREIASYHEHGKGSAITPAVLARKAQRALDNLQPGGR